MLKHQICALVLVLVFASIVKAEERLYYFTAPKSCKYCRIIEDRVLPKPRVQEQLKKYKGRYYYVDVSKLTPQWRTTLKTSVWKVSFWPQFVLIDLDEEDKLTVLSRWSATNGLQTPLQINRNKNRLVDWLAKFSEKKQESP